jgi:two-component system cell cycle sensor histidine kinase/response regulator CckA
MQGIGNESKSGILRAVLPQGRDGDVKGRDDARERSVLFDLISSGGSVASRTLAAELARDFVGLLGPMLGGASLFAGEIHRDHPLRDRLEDALQAVSTASTLARRLVLLDPKPAPTLQRAETKALLREWSELLCGMSSADITFEATPVSTSDFVRVDRRQLAHAIVELGQNALEAMPGGGKLQLEICLVQGEGGPGRLPIGRWIRVRLRDSGGGIEPWVLDRGLDLFVTTKAAGVGAGLGLPVVAAIVRRHSGLLAVETGAGRGTAVSIFLPIHVTMTKASDLAASRSGEAQGVVGQGAAVLVVEDNQMVRRSIEVTLRAAGYRVTSVDSGERCIEEVARLNEGLDLIISDVVMPEMTGDQLLDRIRQVRPHLPVLFISGYDRSSLARRKLPVMNEHFLQKPFDSEDLFEAVHKALASRSGGDGG